MTAIPSTRPPSAPAHRKRRSADPRPNAVTRRRLRSHPRVLAVGIGLGALTLLTAGCVTGAAVAGDTLTVTGSAGPDTIVLRLKAGDPNTLEIDDSGDGTANLSFDRQTFSKIVVNAGAGDDTLRIDRSNGAFTDTELTTLAGEEGNDTLIGDVGAETLDGGPGSDFMDGNQGSDTMLGGDGPDLLQWDPGDGSDVVEGGADTDRLRFNGSNIAEAFDVAANGGRVRFFRNISNITMDMDDVETLSLAELGGADTLTVGALLGTDLTTVESDLAASGGGDDGQVDEVLVPPGTTIGQDGPFATIDGLGAQVRVLAGAPTDRIHVNGPAAADTVTVTGSPDADTVTATANGTDVDVRGATPGVFVTLTSVETLAMNLGAGNDHFSASGGLAPLTALRINGEGGQDTLLGGTGADLLTGGDGDDFIDGNQGSDVVLAGADNDTIQWDPGDGSDVVEGQTGTDQLLFNGANLAERFDVSANGGRIRMTRDIGNIAMDLNDIEKLGLNELGGADTLTVNDLSGTDLGTVDASLAAFGGGTDSSFDEVVVNGTAGDDTVTVDGTSGLVEVRGLAATVRVRGGETTDKLTVNGLGGADTITATQGASTAMVLNLLP